MCASVSSGLLCGLIFTSTARASSRRRCVTSQRGLSGIDIIPIASARPGTAARPSIHRHAAAGASIAQTTYESRMPTVTASWNSETNVPRIRAGDTSAMYIGAPTEVSPIPQPTRNRPAINVGTLLARNQRGARAGKAPARGVLGRAPPATVGEHAGDHGRRQGPDGHRADDQPLGSRLDREVLPDVEDRPRDDARIVAKQSAADRSDDRDHRDEGGHFTLGFRRAWSCLGGHAISPASWPGGVPHLPPWFVASVDAAANVDCISLAWP